jgi:exodeoxyribonuclease VII small subunit
MDKIESKDLTYEQAYSELENIVNYLENGELSLEESIKAFEKGIGLVRLCNKMLDDIEKRITIIIEGKDGVTEKDFTPEGC